MSNLLNRLKSYIDLKNNRLAKIYLLIFYVLNAIYLYLEVSKEKLGILFDTHPEQQKFYFDKIWNITTITSSIGTILFIINVIYLILNVIKYKDKRNKGITEYLIISFISLLSIIIVSIILNAIFSVYYLFEPILSVAEVTIVVFVIALIIAAYRYLSLRSKHEI